MPTPSVNIQDGSVVGTLATGQPFYWYNPTAAAVTITNCGLFTTQDSYTIQPGAYTEAVMRTVPNTNPYGFSSPAWNTPGIPHIQNPPEQSQLEEVA